MISGPLNSLLLSRPLLIWTRVSLPFSLIAMYFHEKSINETDAHVFLKQRNHDYEYRFMFFPVRLKDRCSGNCIFWQSLPSLWKWNTLLTVSLLHLLAHPLGGWKSASFSIMPAHCIFSLRVWTCWLLVIYSYSSVFIGLMHCFWPT